MPPRPFPLAPALAAAWMVTVAGVPARADDAKAQAARSFLGGTEAYGRRDFATAGRAFDDAYRLSPRGAAAYNAGLAWESAGQRSRAADDYTRALEASDLGGADRADATGRLRALERTLALVSVTSPEGARLTLDDVELPGSSPTLHVEPGPHALHAQYPDGRTETEPFVARAGGTQRVTLGRPAAGPVAESRGSTDPVDEPAVTPRPSPREVPRPPDHSRAAASPSPDRTLAWVALGGAVVASGVAVILYEEGLTARNEFDSGGKTSQSLQNEATALRTATWVAWGAAGVLGVTGIVLYLTARPDASSPAVAVDGREVRLRLAF